MTRNPKLFTRRPRNQVLLALACFASLECMALAHVWVRMQVVAIGYDIAREKQTSVELGRQNQRLRIEVDWLKNPSRVEAIALRDLRMGPVDPARIRVLRLEGSASEGPRQLARR